MIARTVTKLGSSCFLTANLQRFTKMWRGTLPRLGTRAYTGVVAVSHELFAPDRAAKNTANQTERTKYNEPDSNIQNTAPLASKRTCFAPSGYGSTQLNIGKLRSCIPAPSKADRVVAPGVTKASHLHW